MNEPGISAFIRAMREFGQWFIIERGYLEPQVFNTIESHLDQMQKRSTKVEKNERRNTNQYSNDGMYLKYITQSYWINLHFLLRSRST